MKRTKLQNAIIHSQKHKLGISEDDYRAAILSISDGRTDSSADLDTKEANQLIEKLGGTAPRAKQGGTVVTLVSAGQRNLITKLSVTRWKENYPTALKAFCQSQKVIGKAYPRTSKEAQRVIETLKAMNSRDGLTTTHGGNNSDDTNHRRSRAGSARPRRAQAPRSQSHTRQRQSSNGNAL